MSVTSISSYSELYQPEHQRRAHAMIVAAGAPLVDSAIDLLGRNLLAGNAVVELGTQDAANLVALREIVGPGGSVSGFALSDNHRKRALMELVRAGQDVGITIHDCTPMWQVLEVASLDAVLIPFLLEQFDPEGIQSILAECRTVLKPTGHLAIVAVTAPASPFRLPAVLRYCHKGPTAFNLRCALEAGGFSPDVVRTSTSMGWTVEVVLASPGYESGDTIPSSTEDDLSTRASDMSPESIFSAPFSPPTVELPPTLPIDFQDHLNEIAALRLYEVALEAKYLALATDLSDAFDPRYRCSKEDFEASMNGAKYLAAADDHQIPLPSALQGLCQQIATLRQEHTAARKGFETLAEQHHLDVSSLEAKLETTAAALLEERRLREAQQAEAEVRVCRWRTIEDRLSLHCTEVEQMVHRLTEQLVRAETAITERDTRIAVLKDLLNTANAACATKETEVQQLQERLEEFESAIPDVQEQCALCLKSCSESEDLTDRLRADAEARLAAELVDREELFAALRTAREEIESLNQEVERMEEAAVATERARLQIEGDTIRLLRAELQLKDAQLQILQSDSASDSARHSESLSPPPLVLAIGSVVECFISQCAAKTLHTPHDAVWEDEFLRGPSDDELHQQPPSCGGLRSSMSGDDQRSEATHDCLSTARSVSSNSVQSVQSTTARSTSSPLIQSARRKLFQSGLSHGISASGSKSKRSVPFLSPAKADLSRPRQLVQPRGLQRRVPGTAVPAPQTARGAKTPSAVGPGSPNRRTARIPSTVRASLIPALV